MFVWTTGNGSNNGRPCCQEVEDSLNDACSGSCHFMGAKIKLSTLSFPFAFRPPLHSFSPKPSFAFLFLLLLSLSFSMMPYFFSLSFLSSPCPSFVFLYFCLSFFISLAPFSLSFLPTLSISPSYFTDISANIMTKNRTTVKAYDT